MSFVVLLQDFAGGLSERVSGLAGLAKYFFESDATGENHVDGFFEQLQPTNAGGPDVDYRLDQRRQIRI